jgi:hypothetical protein
MAKGRKTGGRRSGSLNKATVEAKAACAELVDDPAYRRSLARRLRTGKLSPAMECLLWYYAKGKPKEEYQADQRITVSWPEGVTERLKDARKRMAGREP